MKNETFSNVFPRLAMMVALAIPVTLTTADAHDPCPNCQAKKESTQSNQCLNCQSENCKNCQDHISPGKKVRSRKSPLASRTQITPQSPICPVPVPAYVGHTTITYGPFMPHHLLYPHVDTYRQKNENGRGIQRTRAAYRVSLQSRLRNLQWNLRSGR